MWSCKWFQHVCCCNHVFPWGAGFVVPRAAGAFMPGFAPADEIKMTPKQVDLASPDSTGAIAGSPPCTPVSQIIRRHGSTASLEVASNVPTGKAEEPNTIPYLRAPTLTLGDPVPDDNEQDTLVDSAPTPPVSIQSTPVSGYYPDNQLGLLSQSPAMQPETLCPPEAPTTKKDTPQTQAETVVSNEDGPEAASSSNGDIPAKNPPETTSTPMATQKTPTQEQCPDGEKSLKPIKQNKYADGTYWKLLESTLQCVNVFGVWLPNHVVHIYSLMGVSLGFATMWNQMQKVRWRPVRMSSLCSKLKRGESWHSQVSTWVYSTFDSWIDIM